jgi:hypothetical protein
VFRQSGRSNDTQREGAATCAPLSGAKKRADFDIADPKWWYEIFDAHMVKISIVVVSASL